MGPAILAACRDANMGGGILCSGASGSGKTNISEWTFLEYVRRGWPALWFCPHGDSAKKLRRQIMLLPPRVRGKVLYIRAADPKRVVSLRPLHVRRGDMSEYEYLARITNRVGHMRNLLVSSVGEGDQGVVGRPLLRKWCTTLFTIGGLSGLNVADLMELLDVSSPVFHLLSELCPNVAARAQLHELPDMRPIDREFEISSTRSRMMALFENVVMQKILGRNDDGVLDMETIIDEGRTVIFDLAPEGMLSREDQKMVANLYLSEFLHCVMERPEKKRRDYLCCIDELPVFDLSAKLISDLLTEIRKFKTKFWLSFQGSSRFSGQQSNEFLQTIINQCRVQIYFAHGANDAHSFAKELSLPSYDAKRVKHEQYSQQQLNDGHEIRTLVDWSTGTREDESVGDTSGTSATSQNNWTRQTGTSESIRREMETLEFAITGAKTDSASQGGSSGDSSSQSTSFTKTQGKSESRSFKQTLLPVYKLIETVSGVQFYSPEEWTLTIARHLAGFQPGECAFYVRGHGVCYGRLPLFIDRMKRTPKTAAKRIAEHDAYLDSLPYYASPEEIERSRQAFLRNLVSQLQLALRDRNSQRARLGSTAPLPADGSGLLRIAGPATELITQPLPDHVVEEPATDAPWEF